MSAGFDISALLRKDPDERLKVTLPYNDEVNVTIRYVSRERVAAILKMATKTIYVKHEPQEQFDHLLYGELLGQEAIDGWEGLVNAGQLFECTANNIAVVMRGWSDFAKFVSDSATNLERLVAAQKENATKNSESTSAES